MASARAQQYSLYLMAFASSFGTITIMTLMPTYIDLLDPSGIVIGLFVSGLAIAQAVATVPIGWAGDRFDKRLILLGAILVSAVAYVLFAFVETSAGFVGARVLQGMGVTGVGLLSLALVSQLAPDDSRANTIGKFNAWKLAAGIVGTLGAGALYQQFGFDAVFGLLVALTLLSFYGVWRYTHPDRTSVGFSYGGLALNRRILTISSFRFQYAFSVTIVRNWVPIYVGVSTVRGGLAFGALAVGVVIAAERFSNMLFQPYTGSLSDRHGRAIFVLFGGGAYGALALLLPFTPTIAAALDPALDPRIALLGIAVCLNALIGVADAFREPASMGLFADEGTSSGGVASSFGIRDLVWKPGSIVAPLVGGVVMTDVGMEWVFYLGGAFALSGVASMIILLVRAHGRGGITSW